MQRIVLTTFLILGCAIVVFGGEPTPTDVQETPVDRLLSQDTTLPIPKPRKAALLIHNNIGDAAPMRIAEYGRQDIKALKAFLVSKGFDEANVFSAESDSPVWTLRSNKRNILGNLDLILDNLGEKDEFFLALTGSGGESEGEQWFLPLGANSEKSDRWLAFGEIVEKIKQSKCGRATILVLTDRRTIYGADAYGKPEIVPDEPSNEARITIVYACSPSERAAENNERKLDAFLANLLDLAFYGEKDAQAALLKGFKSALEATNRFANENETSQNPTYVQF